MTASPPPPAPAPSFVDKVVRRCAGICLYGIAPPKRSTPRERLERVAAKQTKRLAELPIDGLIVYDIQDEAERVAEPRPFPFLPTVDPATYAFEHLARVSVPRIVYRSVGGDTEESLSRWLTRQTQGGDRRAPPTSAGGTVLVGAPSGTAQVSLPLRDAYALAQRSAPGLLVGGIAIAERHARHENEHARILGKMRRGCRFFVSQAVYDVTASKSLLCDLHLAAQRAEVAPPPLVLTFAPCANERTLAFMKWLGISFPRWLDNDLRHSADPLATSLTLCERTFDELWDYARDKNIPLGINVESVSIRKAEIDASTELLRTLHSRMR